MQGGQAVCMCVLCVHVYMNRYIDADIIIAGRCTLGP